MTGAGNALTTVEQALQTLKASARRTARAVPAGGAELAGRKLVAALTVELKQAGLPANGVGATSLLGLVELIFDDLMIGGDAEGAVRDWRNSQAPNSADDTVGALIDLVLA